MIEPVACGTLLGGAGVNDEGSFGFEDTVYLPKTLSSVVKARASLWFKVMEYLLHSRDEFQSNNIHTSGKTSSISEFCCQSVYILDTIDREIFMVKIIRVLYFHISSLDIFAM